MNILVLTPFPPFPPNSGGKIRIFNLIKMISKYNNVSLITLVQNDEIGDLSGLEKYCDVYALPFNMQKYGRLKSILSRYPYLTMSKYYSLETQKQINRIINNNNFQIIQVELLLMSAYVNNITNVPKVYDTHNIESDILYRTFKGSRLNDRSIFNFIDYLKNKKYEPDVISSFDACLSVSKKDSERLREMGARKLMTLPNCVDLDYFYPIAREDFDPKIVFTGLMNWYPNMDAINIFCKEAYPALKKKIPEIKFYIVGRNPNKNIQKLGKSDDIYVTGEVSDVRPFVSNSDICIVPLRIGGGTRLKILEYLAMKKPVISTSIGAEGLEVENGKHLIIEDKISKFPDRIVELLNDPDYARFLAKNGRKLVEEKYSWSQYGEDLNILYKGLLDDR